MHKRALSEIDMLKMQAGIKKHAGLWSSLATAYKSAPLSSKILDAGTNALAAAAVTTAIAGTASGIEAIKNRIEKPRLYKAMLEINPRLKEVDQKKTTTMFNTIYNLNKDMARDPVVASSFVDRALSQAEGLSGLYIDPSTTKMMMDRSPAPGPVLSAALSAAAAGVGRTTQFEQLRREQIAAQNKQR